MRNLDNCITAFAPGDENFIVKEQSPDPQPPEGFVDSTVKLGRLQPDGSIEWYGTQDPFPEGYDDPKKFRSKPLKKEREEAINMPAKKESPGKEVLQALWNKHRSFNGIAKELGVGWGCVKRWFKEEGINLEESPRGISVNPEFEKALPWPAEQAPLQQRPQDDNFDEEFDAALAKQLDREDETKIYTPHRQNYTITQYKEQTNQGGFTAADDDPIPCSLPPEPGTDLETEINWVKIELIKTAICETEARDLPGEVILNLIRRIEDLDLGVGA